MVYPKLKLNSSKKIGLAFLLLMLLWGYSLLAVPTFDLDESLYRRVSDEMLRNHQFWNPTWDGVPLFHKPPLLYWLIILCSKIMDGSSDSISTFSARLPSLFSSVGILFGLFCSVPFILKKNNSPSDHWATVLFYLSAFFPILTGTSVIFDPLQTLFLIPPLLFFTHFFYSRDLNRTFALASSFCVFMACAIKGLNGLIIPGLAFVLHSLAQFFDQRNRTRLNISCFLTAGAWVFTPAIVLSAAFYLYLDAKMGRAFSHEFFWVQHFGRSQQAMEMHGGSFFYHPLFVWASGGFFTLLMGATLTQRSWDYLKLGFPTTFAAAFIIFFSFSATKLPHYTWPVWSALALQCGLIYSLNRRSLTSADPGPVTKVSANSTQKIVQAIRLLCRIPLVFWCVVFLLASLNPMSWLIHWIHSSEAVALLRYFDGIPLPSSILLFSASILCGVVATRAFMPEDLPLLAAINLFCCLVLATTLIPPAQKLLIDPPQEVAKYALDHYLHAGDCLYYSGPHSPNMSITLGYEIFHNRCEPSQMTFLITPEWKQHECVERNFQILRQNKYLVLCGKVKDASGTGHD